MKEFQINDYITLKLEEGKTNIYVAGELFNQCKFLLLNIPIKEISALSEIKSVDEAAENLSKEMEGNVSPWAEKKIKRIEIPPETEFWAHCSNLQVWSEHNYDTRLIHSNLAFPLLKKLTEVGDPLAKRVFREEIAKRLERGYWPVIEFLIEGEYTDYLSREEFLQCILEDENEINFLREIEKRNDITFYLEKDLSGEYNNFTVRDRHVVGLCIDSLKVESVLPSFSYIESLEELILINSGILHLPDSICKLNFLLKLNLLGNNLKTLPYCIGYLKNLEELDLENNQIDELPQSFENLKSLKELYLGHNEFTEVPKELNKLTNLEKLRLNSNQIHSVSNLGNLNFLKFLDLSRNMIKELPESILKLQNLKRIVLRKNLIEERPIIKKKKNDEIEIIL